MLRHMMAYRETPDIPAQEAADMAWQELTPMLGFGLSIPVFFATTYGWVLWILVPLASVRLRQLKRRNPRGPETT